MSFFFMSDEDRVSMVQSPKTKTETETRGFKDQDQDEDSEVPRPRPRPRLITRNSTRDEIANVNFLYDDIVQVRLLQNTIDSCINSAIDRRGYVLKKCLTNSVKWRSITAITPFKVIQVTDVGKVHKKLIRKWDSERELSLRRHRTRTTKYNRLVHKFPTDRRGYVLEKCVYQIQWNNAI